MVSIGQDGPTRTTTAPRLTTTGGASARTAEQLRAMIAAGELKPGRRLDEERVRQELEVSRSTLREAFRMLSQERLLEHHLSRGVFVRQLSHDDVRDLYRVRHLIEEAALASVQSLSTAQLRDLSAAAQAGQEAADKQEWEAAASANIAFHQMIVRLAGSARLDEVFGKLLAEFRLAYAQMKDTAMFHGAFLARNAIIADLIRSGEIDMAVVELRRYLADSEEALLDAMGSPGS